MEVSDRIKQRMQSLNVKAADIAKNTGANKGSISTWLNTGTVPSGKNLINLAIYLRCSSEWLLTGRGEIEPDSNNVSAGPEIKGLVPLISWVQAGQWSEAIDLFEPYEAEELFPCPASHGAHTYALRVEGDSMTSPVGRSYPEGSLIYVDPEQNGCSPGDRVIAKRNGENGVTFKQLAKDGDRHYLKPLNPNHPPIFDEFKILGKVIGMWMDD